MEPKGQVSTHLFSPEVVSSKFNPEIQDKQEPSWLQYSQPGAQQTHIPVSRSKYSSLNLQ